MFPGRTSWTQTDNAGTRRPDPRILEKVAAEPDLCVYNMHSIYFFRMTVMSDHLHLLQDQVYPFDARGIAKRFRHAAIFGALDALNSGERMRFVNDHDPLPLLDQLRNRYGAAVDIQYLKREPGEIVIDFIRS